MSDWHFGEIASCHALMDEGISLAKELRDTNALVLALTFAACLAYLERDPAEAKPSESQRSRSRFRYKNAQKQLTQSI